MAEESPDKAVKASMTSPEAASSKPVTPSGLNPDVQAHIGKQLRAVYDDVANEPIPDRFLQLLRDLGRKQERKI